MTSESAKARLIFLPGLDGSGELLEPIVRAAQANPALSATVIAFPEGGPQSISALAAHVLDQLDEETGRYSLVAESFAGPVALRVAAAQPQGLDALVLVNSFVTAPRPASELLALSLTLPWVGSVLPPPYWAIRRYMLGADAEDELVESVRRAVARLPARTLAARLRGLAFVNEAGSYLRMQLPLFYLRGRQDVLLDKSALDRLIRLRPGLQLHEIDGPHLLLQRHPEAALKRIVACLNERNFA
jgi:pimeloyl-ACP methyl ester carboxylesterase